MIETGARRREIDEVAASHSTRTGYAATSARDIAKALDIAKLSTSRRRPEGAHPAPGHLTDRAERFGK
jgi:hypothetical protein